MAVSKSLRFLAVFSGCVLLYLILQMFGTENPIGRKGSGETTPELMRDPNLDPTTEPPEPLWRHDNYGADNEDSPRINATLLSLVRNNELDAMVETMKQLERKFNHKFNYPWIFFNNEPFSDDFKEKTKEQTKAKVRYELIPKEHWEVPSWIQNDLLLESADILANKKVQYARMLSYHQMCRWNSGMFYKHPALEHTRYYWRVEPKVKFFCDIDYDVFRYMQDHNKTYGFTINLYEDPNSIPTLWPETEKFMAEHPEFIHENSAMDWLTDSKRQEHHEKSHGYSTCHFWSNFEIADMDFWRSPAYEAYFNHLDRAGGFFYERWGDAPVHSIALGLFEDKSKIHWFRDIGYQHIPFFNCPNSPKCENCRAGLFTDGESWLNKEDCRPNWFKYVGMG